MEAERFTLRSENKWDMLVRVIDSSEKRSKKRESKK